MRYVVTASLLSILALWADAHAEVQTKTVEYEHGDLKLEGLLAWDDGSDAKRPAVLVVHEWWGLDDHAKRRARQLAGLGYVAFAVDMYGEGKLTKHPSEAGQWAAEVNQNVGQWRERGLAGLKTLRNHPLVDTDSIAAIGYCFGGATVLQLAYAGADLKGVVSFHGALPVLADDDAGAIKAKILVCHGADDAFVPEPQIRQFRKALEEAGADYQFIYYSGARHSFTNRDADGHDIDGLKYDKKTDRRSWQQMQSFFEEIFEVGG